MRWSFPLTVIVVALINFSDGIPVPNIRGWKGIQVQRDKRINVTDVIAQKVTNVQECLRLCWRLTFCQAVTYSPGTEASCTVAPYFPSAANQLMDDVTAVVMDMSKASLDKPRMYGCDKRPCLETEICVTVQGKSHHLCLSLGTARCGDPPTINNTIVTKDGFSRAYYTCVSGYLTSTPNSMTSTCDRASGHWSTVEGKCDFFSCGIPPSVEKATVQYTSTVLSSVATYTCFEGHRSKGQLEMKIACQEDGEWTETLQPCLAVDCGQPMPVSNAVVTFPNTTSTVSLAVSVAMNSSMPVENDSQTLVGAVVEHSCETGHVSDPETVTSICQVNGQWSQNDSLVCIPVDCGQPEEKELTDRIYNQTVYLSSVEYQCIKGYNMEDVQSLATSVCDSSGLWTPVSIACVLVDCQEPRAPPGFGFSFNQTTFGAKAEISCLQPGKFWLGEKFKVCQASGEWSVVVGNCVDQPCGEAPDLPNADVSISTLHEVEGLLATYTCHLGYQWDHHTGTDHTLTCTAEGQSWLGDVQVSCHVISCGQPPEVPNAEVKTDDGLSYLASATYSCLQGYELATPNHVRKCTHTGQWSKEKIRCQEKKCGRPPSISRSKSIPEDKLVFAIGESVTYECQRGYVISLWPNMFTCLEKGWEHTSVSCLNIKCQEPPRVESSTWKISRSEPHVVTYICYEGFRLQDPESSSLTCTSKKTPWGSTSEIEKIRCVPDDKCGAPPEVANASLSYTSASVGAEAVYTCAHGFSLAHDSKNKRVCNNTSQWTDDAIVCEPIDCGAPRQVENAVASFTSTSYNAIVIYTCNTSFELIDEVNSRQCTVTAEWSRDFIECKPMGSVSCSEPPNIGNATAHYHSRLSGTLVQYQCDLGFEHIWFEMKMCTLQGAWTEEKIVCEEVDCRSPPSVSHASASTNGTTFGSVVVYTCDEGYDLKTNDSSQVCLATGRWSDELIECGDPTQSSCPRPPEAPNAIVKVHSVLARGEASYKCADGYEMQDVDAASLTCLDGAWSGETIQCVPKDCGPPPDVFRASLLYTSTVFGSTVKHVCERGSSLVGISVRVCQANGNWSNGLVECRLGRGPVCLEPPPQIEGTTVYYTGHEISTDAVYVCHKGYTGGGRYVCSGDSEWVEEESVTCEPIQCSDPPLLPLTYRQYQSIEYTSIAVYTCNVSKFSHGPVRSRCLANGTWASVSNPCRGCFENPPEVANALLSNSSGYIGGKAYFSCLSGFQSNSTRALERTCLESGHWSREELKCVAISVCNDPPVLDNAVLKSVNSMQDYVKAVYNCSRGYRSSNPKDRGRIARRCDEENGWDNHNYTCLPVECGDPPEKNGTKILGENTTYGSLARYHCLNWSINDTSICQANGTWSPSRIVCPVCDLNANVERGRLAPLLDRVTEAHVECNEWSTLLLLNGRQDDVMQCTLGSDMVAIWEGLEDFFCLQVLWLNPPVIFAAQILIQKDLKMFETCLSGTPTTRFTISLIASKPDSIKGAAIFTAVFDWIPLSTSQLTLSQTSYLGLTLTEPDIDVRVPYRQPLTVCVQLITGSMLFTVHLNSQEVGSVGTLQIDPTEVKTLVVDGGIQLSRVEFHFPDLADQTIEPKETSPNPSQTSNSAHTSPNPAQRQGSNDNSDASGQNKKPPIFIETLIVQPIEIEQG